MNAFEVFWWDDASRVRHVGEEQLQRGLLVVYFVAHEMTDSTYSRAESGGVDCPLCVEWVAGQIEALRCLLRGE